MFKLFINYWFCIKLIVLVFLNFKAELVDVLRKRRNRPEASDEDLGLPRSPTTPQGPKSHLVPQPTATLINVSSNRHSSSSVSAPGGGSDTEEDLSSTMGNNSYSYDTSKSLDETGNGFYLYLNSEGSNLR